MTPEWIAVAVSVIVAVASGIQIWQNINIKLAFSKMETSVEIKIGAMREWSRDTFVSKHDQMSLLELMAKNDGREKERKSN